MVTPADVFGRGVCMFSARNYVKVSTPDEAWQMNQKEAAGLSADDGAGDAVSPLTDAHMADER